MPVIGRRWQPLAAVYRTSLLAVVEELLGRDERRVSRLFERARVHTLDRTALLANPALAAGDPELESIVNLNDPAAYARARGRPAPVIGVSWTGRAAGPAGEAAELDGGGRQAGAIRAATLAGLADAIGIVLDGRAGVELNGRRVSPDPELPLERGDTVVFDRV